MAVWRFRASSQGTDDCRPRTYSARWRWRGSSPAWRAWAVPSLLRGVWLAMNFWAWKTFRHAKELRYQSMHSVFPSASGRGHWGGFCTFRPLCMKALIRPLPNVTRFQNTSRVCSPFPSRKASSGSTSHPLLSEPGWKQKQEECSIPSAEILVAHVPSPHVAQLRLPNV